MTVIDPLHRWRKHGEKPDYAGLLTFGALPWTEDPAELAGVDVAAAEERRSADPVRHTCTRLVLVLVARSARS
jgi:hypothetical protein